MAILRSYSCPRHGVFDGWEAECPHGCKDVTQVFTKAFAIKSQRTKNTDATLKGLASDFKMTNIKSTREGDHQEGYFTRNNKPAEKEKGYEAANGGVMWGGGGNLNMASALSGSAVKSVGEKLGKPPEPLRANLSGFGPLQPSIVQNDHEGLKINADSK